MQYRYFVDFDSVFQYLPISLTVLRYWEPPDVPLRKDKATLSSSGCSMREAKKSLPLSVQAATEIQRRIHLFHSTSLAKQPRLHKAFWFLLGPLATLQVLYVFLYCIIFG